MIRITPDDLVFARMLGAIRRRKVRLDGPKGWLNCHQLHYRGDGSLIFRTTDRRVGMVSRFRIEGDDDPWSCQVPYDNFDYLARDVAGGRYTLNAHPERSILVEKPHKEPDGRIFQLKYPLFRLPIEAAYPGVENVPADLQWSAVSLASLKNIVTFLIPDLESKDQHSKLESSTIHANDQSLGWHRGVFLRATGITLPFEFHVHDSDGRRLGNWLRLVAERASEVRIAKIQDTQGRTRYLVVTADGEHMFEMIAASRTLPSTLIQNTQQESPLIEGVVPGQLLRQMAGFFRAYTPNLLLFEFKKTAAGQWQLNVGMSIEGTSGGGPLQIEVRRETDLPLASLKFLVAPDHLFVAVERLDAKQLALTYHRRSRTLVLRSEPNNAGPVAENREAILRVDPVDAGQDATTQLGRPDATLDDD